MFVINKYIFIKITELEAIIAKDNTSPVQTNSLTHHVLAVKYRKFQWKAWESYKVSAITKEK